MKKIEIAGGGLAGLALGIGLRQRGVPVTIWEAGRYPRHRVCGEFISGPGQRVLADLGLENEYTAAGACLARTAGFFGPRLAFSGRLLPQPAICLSRYVMDDLLARHFRALGGDLRENARWKGSLPEGMIRATGRRGEALVNGWRWFGLKAHARGVDLESDLEVYCAPEGYVGLCRLANGEVNVCGLFRTRSAIPDLVKTWQERLRGTPESLLLNRMREAVFEPGSFCAVAGLYLTPQEASGREECCIGDSLTMIAPVTGNGMSMAFESAALALGPLRDYSHGELSWPEARSQIGRACDGRFAERLKWGMRAHAGLLLKQPWNDAFLWLASLWPPLWPALFARTRGLRKFETPASEGRSAAA